MPVNDGRGGRNATGTKGFNSPGARFGCDRQSPVRPAQANDLKMLRASRKGTTHGSRQTPILFSSWSLKAP